MCSQQRSTFERTQKPTPDHQPVGLVHMAIRDTQDYRWRSSAIPVLDRAAMGVQ